MDTGQLAAAAPIFQGRPGQRLMLIGQAPGQFELGPRKPFAARSGRELARWMQRAGFADDDEFRALTYVTSVTKCFPGRSASGAGDRRPGAVEVANCRPWLDAQLDLVRPRLIILAGTLAIGIFLPGRGLDSLVGEVFGAAEPYLLPLPHPSGASRWLNDPAHRRLLEQGLMRLGTLWPRLCS